MTKKHIKSTYNMTFADFLQSEYPLFKSHDLDDAKVTVGEMKRLVALYLKTCN